MTSTPPYPGIRITTNGNQLVAYHTEARLTEGGVFYPITPSTEMGEQYQLSTAEGNLNVFGRPKIAIEAEGEHAAQGGAIAYSVTGKRVVSFTSGQGIVYGLEQFYHAPGKLSTMVTQVAARALTKHALNVHCGHDDVYAAMDTGWTILFAKDSQQAADQSLILRRVNELSLGPGINAQDGFLTSHLERTFFKHEADLIREYLGAPEDMIDCPTEAQVELFGPRRRRVPVMIDLKSPLLLGPVQNQEHYMNGVVARRDKFSEHILGMLEEAYSDFAALTGRSYGMMNEYRTDDAEVVFFSMGSAAENIEAAVDMLRVEGQSVGSIHLNVLRPFPEAALVKALAGKKAVIILERTDEPLSGDNPLTREVRATLEHALEGSLTSAGLQLPPLTSGQRPELFSGCYGLGSRDFRPEAILGAYEFATGQTARADGAKASDGTRYFVLGVDHPREVVSKRTPSLLPDGAIAVRLHSIGGWGMITTGKNLGEIIGAFGDDLAKRAHETDSQEIPAEVLHVSANPKYGSEKKGAPTAYFLVVAPERVRVNCDLRHVNVVLCCDPKAFTHSNPLDGIAEGGTFVWESSEEPELAWKRIPHEYRQEIIDKKVRLFTLPGFDIARDATDREELQLRMQGNAFLGAFFRVSGFLEDNNFDESRFADVVRAQYVKKFGRFGDSVVESNMTVMQQGFAQVCEVPHGTVDATDLSSMRHEALCSSSACGVSEYCKSTVEQPERVPLAKTSTFDAEFRAGLGYFQPASTFSSVSVMAAATGATASKYVARRETPLWIAENCTQCMECIVACPDTALPNTAQDISTVFNAAAQGFVDPSPGRDLLLAELPAVEERVRERMRTGLKAREPEPFKQLVANEIAELTQVSQDVRESFMQVFERIPFAYEKTPLVFGAKEKKEQGSGGLFAIFVSDLCKGCGECVTECGDKDALVMAKETEGLNADHVSGTNFMDRLPDTPTDYLGRYDEEHPEESHALALKNHLMVRSHYEAIVSGDGACAGCGEKSAMRAMASVTEAVMRPAYHRKADRLEAKATALEATGAASLEGMDSKTHALFARVVAQVVLGQGGENEADTTALLNVAGLPDNGTIIDALCTVLRQDAFNHRDLQAIDGRLANGMSVMAMGAHTGCNTVFGSTPPNNPHPYPWMNSLFQDGTTITWLFGESFIADHAARSVVPERLVDAILSGTTTIDDKWVFTMTHMTDAAMTDLEVQELPKAWAIGGDGGMGDIGFQNVSKVVLQNRPNIKVMMLDTQVYSNTGGQNSDSTPMPGGGDMNSLGAASQGKYTEKKNVAEIFTGGHGSPYVAQVSLANVANLYRSLIDGLAYRGTAFYQVFTSCQPEHGVADDVSSVQARSVRDSRCMPEFTFNPQLGEMSQDAFSLKGNPNIKNDWAQVKSKARGEKYTYTIAHWAATEARFRRHFKPAKDTTGTVTLEDLLLRVTQHDVIQRNVLNEEHHAYVPEFSTLIMVDRGDKTVQLLCSRQMVLFCVERRRAWRMLQSRAGVASEDYRAQRDLLERLKTSDITQENLVTNTRTLFDECLNGPLPADT